MDGPHEDIDIAGVAKIDAGGIDGKDRRRGRAKVEEVGFAELFEVGGVHRLFVGAATLGDPIEEDRGGSVEIDDQIGGRDVAFEDRIDLVEEIHLVSAEVQAGEDPALSEEIIADRVRGEEFFLVELDLLAVARQKKEEFGLKGVAVAVEIKEGKKGVFVELFEDKASVKMPPKCVCEGGFSDPDRAFDGDITGRFGQVQIVSSCHKKAGGTGWMRQAPKV